MTYAIDAFISSVLVKSNGTTVAEDASVDVYVATVVEYLSVFSSAVILLALWVAFHSLLMVYYPIEKPTTVMSTYKSQFIFLIMIFSFFPFSCLLYNKCLKGLITKYTHIDSFQ